MMEGVCLVRWQVMSFNQRFPQQFQIDSVPVMGFSNFKRSQDLCNSVFARQELKKCILGWTRNSPGASSGGGLFGASTGGDGAFRAVNSFVLCVSNRSFHI